MHNFILQGLIHMLFSFKNSQDISKCLHLICTQPNHIQFLYECHPESD